MVNRYRKNIQDDREQHDKEARWQKRTFAHFWEIRDAKYQGGLIPESSVIWTNSEINGRELLSRWRETCTPTPQLIEICLTRLVSNKSQWRSNARRGFSHWVKIPDDVNEFRDDFGRGSAKLGPMQRATGPNSSASYNFTGILEAFDAIHIPHRNPRVPEIARGRHRRK
ncbi:hypothetical protein C8R44DRAFT_731250 [Mycena epipterygia]|nr:hypothetical protein C8R44DRAFT_731250 [Mycena epipterygia]